MIGKPYSYIVTYHTVLADIASDVFSFIYIDWPGNIGKFPDGGIGADMGTPVNVNSSAFKLRKKCPLEECFFPSNQS
jgi:hypothetical protein